MQLRWALLILAACGGSSGGTSGDDDTGGVDAAAPSTFGGVFRHGMNDGHINGAWTDNQGGALGAAAGADSNRMKLPEYFLAQWGADIRVDAAKSYQAVGMSNLVCFLIGPTAAHSTDPSGTNLEAYIPKNLYEPIFTSDGGVNPDNYWGAYVAETVTAYHPYVKIWEVWNEPDWVSDYNLTLGWATKAPTKADLPRFNGSIHDYIRMLRITYAVAKKIDPDAQIALGGIGYPTFLSALLRYTDNPDGGAVTSDFPRKADAYFDVLNFHYYPLYTPGNSDAGSDGMFALRDAFQAELTKAGVTGKTWNATETGAPRVQLGAFPGGEAYARNYLLKVMLRAHLEKLLGLDWFLLSDTAGNDPYNYMGLYFNIASLGDPSQAMRTQTGTAYTTLGALLKGATVDETRTAALQLPANARGGAFHTTDGKTILALWATGSDENATATYDVGTAMVTQWDGTTSTASGSVTLTSTPQFFAVP